MVNCNVILFLLIIFYMNYVLAYICFPFYSGPITPQGTGLLAVESVSELGVSLISLAFPCHSYRG